MAEWKVTHDLEPNDRATHSTHGMCYVKSVEENYIEVELVNGNLVRCQKTQLNYYPTPEEIRSRAKLIREQWSDYEWCVRSGAERGRYEIEEIGLGQHYF